MRKLLPLFAALSIGGCAVAPPVSAPNPQDQARIAQLLAGKAPGAPRKCLPNYSLSQLAAVTNDTVAFRDGSTTWVAHTDGSCANLNSGYTLVFKSVGLSSGPCSGDTAQVVDIHSGIVAGICTFGDFVPYKSVG